MAHNFPRGMGVEWMVRCPTGVTAAGSQPRQVVLGFRFSREQKLPADRRMGWDGMDVRANAKRHP